MSWLIGAKLLLVCDWLIGPWYGGDKLYVNTTTLITLTIVIMYLKEFWLVVQKQVSQDSSSLKIPQQTLTNLLDFVLHHILEYQTTFRNKMPWSLMIKQPSCTDALILKVSSASLNKHETRLVKMYPLRNIIVMASCLSSDSSHLFSIICSNERAPSATPSDFSGHRPLSVISTLSSESKSSEDDVLALSQSTHNSDIDLDQNPEGEVEPRSQPDQSGRAFTFAHINQEAMPHQGSRRHELTSPLITRSMAPNPQLTYLDRVVMELIETERMYVRNLQMIVEVSHNRTFETCNYMGESHDHTS